MIGKRREVSNRKRRKEGQPPARPGGVIHQPNEAAASPAASLRARALALAQLSVGNAVPYFSERAILLGADCRPGNGRGRAAPRACGGAAADPGASGGPCGGLPGSVGGLTPPGGLALLRARLHPSFSFSSSSSPSGSPPLFPFPLVFLLVFFLPL